MVYVNQEAREKAEREAEAHLKRLGMAETIRRAKKWQALSNIVSRTYWEPDWRYFYDIFESSTKKPKRKSKRKR